MAVKALNVFRAYAKKSYIDTANEFNNKLNISEKRAVVVALHKIGVPFEISTKDDFDHYCPVKAGKSVFEIVET